MTDQTPQYVINEWKNRCSCCPDCHQEIPCGGVMAGSVCDNFCDCDEILSEEEYYHNNNI